MMALGENGTSSSSSSGNENGGNALRRYLLERGIRIVVVPSKGRCLVTNRAVRRGDVILKQEPYCSILDESHLRCEGLDESRLRCDGCFVVSSNLLRCSACKAVRYCSGECQRKEWKLHKYECRLLGSRPMQEKPKQQTMTLRLMVRLLIKKLLQSDGVIPKTPVDSYELVEALPTHFTEMGGERLLLFAQMSALLNEVLPAFEVDLKETTRLFCTLSCNAHTMCDEELRPIGSGLYPVLSIMNHSCAPNAVLLFDGKTAVVRSLEDLSEGTEITISYIELAASTPTRQKTLNKHYFFDCSCSRCLGRETSEGLIEDAILEGYKCSKLGCDGACLPLSDEKRLVCYTCGSIQVEFKLRTRKLEAEKALDEARKADNCGRVVDDVRARELYESVEILEAKVYHRYSVPLMRTRDTLLKMCMSLEAWEPALGYCQLTVPAYERAYSSYSPLLGLQYYTLGKLEWYLGNTKDAVESLTHALAVLTVTHSTSSTLVQGLYSLLQEARAEAEYQRNEARYQSRDVPCFAN